MERTGDGCPPPVAPEIWLLRVAALRIAGVVERRSGAQLQRRPQERKAWAIGLLWRAVRKAGKVQDQLDQKIRRSIGRQPPVWITVRRICREPQDIGHRH